MLISKFWFLIQAHVTYIALVANIGEGINSREKPKLNALNDSFENVVHVPYGKEEMLKELK